jgi:selenocysteine-specific elongation factor
MALSAARAGDFLGAELAAGAGPVLGHAELLRLTQLPPAAAEEAVAARARDGALADLGAGAWLVPGRAAELRAAIEKTLARYHAVHPNVWGMEPGNVCRQLSLPAGSFAKLKAHLAEGGRMVVRHGYLALADWQPAISPQQLELRAKLLARLERAGTDAPARGDLAKEFGASESDMRLVLRLLTEEGLVSVFGTNIILTSVVEDCRSRLVGLFANRRVASLTEFRKVTGLSRNTAVAVLESFDARGLTRRVEGGRELFRPEEAGE